jgi:hypothetical protein
MKEGRSSFLKKRTKKLFCSASRGVGTPEAPGAEKFLRSFFQKATAYLGATP